MAPIPQQKSTTSAPPPPRRAFPTSAGLSQFFYHSPRNVQPAASKDHLFPLSAVFAAHTLDVLAASASVSDPFSPHALRSKVATIFTLCFGAQGLRGFKEAVTLRLTGREGALMAAHDKRSLGSWK